MRLIGVLLIISLCGCTRPPVLTVKDRTGLAVYLAFNVVTTISNIPDNKPDLKPGDPCPECGGRGKKGDGTNEYTCDDCKGTGKVLPKASKVSYNDSIHMVPEIGIEAVQKTWPPRTLPDSNITPTSKTISSTHVVIHTKKPVIRRSNDKWSVGGKKTYTAGDLLEHLRTEHHFDASGYDLQEMETIHDNLHNGYTAHGDM